MTAAIKNMRGDWKCEEYHNLLPGKQLQVSTMKVSSGAVTTVARAGTLDRGMFTYAPYSDYSKTLAASRPLRATQNHVERQHTQCVNELNPILEEARKHYE